jgi:hypothetical protein
VAVQAPGDFVPLEALIGQLLSGLSAQSLQATSTDSQLLDSLDSDGDGLTDKQEFINGTDPNNPDTNNDGYLDGEEVKAGYNSLGPGSF